MLKEQENNSKKQVPLTEHTFKVSKNHKHSIYGNQEYRSSMGFLMSLGLKYRTRT